MTSWINCNDRLPEMANDGFGARESAWVLVRTRAQRVFVARLRQLEDSTPEWIMRGPDGYEMPNVVEWCEVPA